LGQAREYVFGGVREAVPLVGGQVEAARDVAAREVQRNDASDKGDYPREPLGLFPTADPDFTKKQVDLACLHD
jgi:hypothetical protein